MLAPRFAFLVFSSASGSPGLGRNRWIARALVWLAALACGPALAADPAMAERTQACTACHGAQGRAGPDGYYPRLAGKPAGYLYNQLRNFQDGRRHYTLMEGLLAPLSDDYLRDMAAYFSSLTPPYPRPLPTAASPAELARGRTLALHGDAALQLPACVQCHGQALTGVMPATPGLLGLPRDYLNAQLGGWQTGQRHAHAPDCMASIARQLTPQDVAAVALWLAAQPVPNPAHAADSRPPRTTGQLPLPLCGSAP
jgi:cytochrome c553